MSNISCMEDPMDLPPKLFDTGEHLLPDDPAGYPGVPEASGKVLCLEVGITQYAIDANLPAVHKLGHLETIPGPFS